VSTPTTRREEIRSRRRTDKQRSNLVWGLVVVGALALVGYLAWIGLRPPQGVAVPIAGEEHIPDGTDPGEYNSNPPTSGNHYGSPMPPGFYEEADLEQFGPYPVGHAVHSLEHGHIIFWYNCDLLSETECAALKSEIRDYLDGSLVPKLIAFPWQGTDVPLVLTSWGYMLEMPEFDARAATGFINANRLKAPEPNAP
jgi:hypothetical protein